MTTAQPQGQTQSEQAASDTPGPGLPAGTGRVTDHDAAGKGLLEAQEDFPAVQEHAIAAAEAEEAANASENGEEPATAAHTPAPARSAPASAAPTDYKGRTFDPAIHETDNANRPVMRYDEKKRKYLLKCKGGRPSANVLPGHRSTTPVDDAPAASTTPAPEAGPTASAPPPVAAPLDEAKCRSAAKVVCAMFFQTAMTIGGKDFAPDYLDDDKTVHERQILEDAVTEYFKATGTIDIPPGVLLLIVVGTYVGKRAMMPSVQARFRAIVARMRGQAYKPADADVVDSAGNGG